MQLLDTIVAIKIQVQGMNILLNSCRAFNLNVQQIRMQEKCFSPGTYNKNEREKMFYVFMTRWFSSIIITRHDE